MNIKLKNTFSGLVALTGICGIFAYNSPVRAEENMPHRNIASYYNDKVISSEKFDNITKIMDAGAEKFKAQKGMLVITDASDSTIIAAYSTDNSAAIEKELFETGAIYKTFTVAMGLEDGNVKDGEAIDTSEPFIIQGIEVKDPNGSLGPLDTDDLLIDTSNFTMERIALKSGAEHQYNFFDKLGMLSEINSDGINGVKPIYPVESEWLKGDVFVATISYGYGVSVTPLHIISAYSAIINGGKYYKPSFEKVENKEGVDVISKENSQIMRKYLRKVVTDGNAKKANSDKYFLMGKTGTADKKSMASGKYDTKYTVSTFVGNFEHNGTDYAILVMLDNPKASKETYGYNTAGWNAVPIAKDIIEEFIK